ncbi:MAG: multicopper oxidase domain-containing protein [Holophagaceae bacterium]|uniref:Multicopper oxidase domain-containing protein n=1 Tax=Candidatus Geothrix odensensis TaxID=2954440 RepID=A0A936K8Z6_9BACT|nr:multicopper oxidase domain-containing protein [Candidatus Geothrix odensensis]
MPRNTLVLWGGGAMVALLVGCGGSTTVVTEKVPVPAASPTELVDPLQLKQFANPLPVIPNATPDTTSRPGYESYTVTAEQTSGFDFGLRKRDGSEFLDPVTNSPIRTTVWGYTINGIKAGYLGASIQARSTLAGETGKPVSVKYVNDLKGPTGALLTQHLLTVDKTMDGSAAGEPEIRVVAHLHGGHVEPEFDGHPLAWITNDPAARTGLPADPVSGRPARPDGNTVTYTYPNTQQAGQIWFHDHALGITRINVYAGLAANYIIRDAQEDSLNLPSGNYEAPPGHPGPVLQQGWIPPLLRGPAAGRHRRTGGREREARLHLLSGVLRQHHHRERQGLALPGCGAAQVPLPPAQRVGFALLQHVARAGWRREHSRQCRGPHRERGRAPAHDGLCGAERRLGPPALPGRARRPDHRLQQVRRRRHPHGPQRCRHALPERG